MAGKRKPARGKPAAGSPAGSLAGCLFGWLVLLVVLPVLVPVLVVLYLAGVGLAGVVGAAFSRDTRRD
jgi:hypothetical protein